MSLERDYQKNLIKRIKKRFQGCCVLKNDSGYSQGIPDLTVFHKDKYAMLECKRSANATKQPNQTYYVNKFNDMSFARFIYPENEKEVLDELEVYFQ